MNEANSKRTVRAAPTPRNVKMVRPVVNAIMILRYLTTVTKPISLSSVARQLKLNTSTCYYILQTLVTERLVTFDRDSRTYTIGIGLFDLSQAALAEGGTVPVVRPLMENLARRYGITVTVWRRVDDNRLMLVALAESDANMRIHMNIGQRVPLLLGAMGRVMAAYGELEEAEIRRRFGELRWQNPLKLETYMRQARKAKRDGWAVDDSHLANGTMTISVPVFDRFERVHMACSATMFSEQHPAAQTALIAKELMDIAAALTKALSGG